jgi:hypothetical protein
VGIAWVSTSLFVSAGAEFLYGQYHGPMLYMIVERFRNSDPVPVYRRFRDKGRMAPEGLSYVSSWVDTSLSCCYQVMSTDEPRLLDEWMSKWADLVDFDVHPVVTSDEAARRVAPRL